MEQFAPLQSTRALTRFFIFFSLLLMSASFGNILGGLIIKSICDCITPDDPEAFLKMAQESPLLVTGIKFSVIVSQLIGFAMPSIFYARLVNVDVAEELGFENQTNLKSYLFAGLLIIAILPIINFTHWLNMQIDFQSIWGELGDQIKKLEDVNGELTRLILPQPGDIKNLLFVTFILGIIPALCEELVFRGVFQRIFTQMFSNRHAGVWVAAFVFSFAHFQFYGFIPRFIMGAVLGYMYMYSRTLWVPMLAHAVNNSLAVFFAYFELDKSETLNTDTLGAGASDWIWLVTSVLISAGLFFLFKKANPQKVIQSTEESI